MHYSLSPQASDTAMIESAEGLPRARYAGEIEEDIGGLGLLDYWRILWRFKWSVISIVVICVGVGVLYGNSLQPIFQAETRILVEYDRPSIVDFRQFEAAPSHWLFYQTQMDIITSRAIAELTVDELGLQRTLGTRLQQGASGVDYWQSFISEFLDWLPPEWSSYIAAEPLASGPLTREDVISMVQAGVSVDGGTETEVITIRYVDVTSRLAADIVNAVAQAYIRFGVSSRVESAKEANTWLEGRAEELRTKLEEAERRLREFQAREGLVDTQNREQLVSARIASLATERVRAQTRRSAAEERYNQIRRIAKDPDQYSKLTGLLNSDLVLEAHRERESMRLRVSKLAERYGEKHPKMIASRAEFQDAHNRWVAEVEKAVGNVRKEYQIARAQERDFVNAEEEEKKEMHELSGRVSDLSKLEREVEANRKLHAAVLDSLKEAGVAKKDDVSNVRILDVAMPPVIPFSPNKRRISTVAALFGLFFGIGLAMLRHHADNTFKSRNDIEQILHLPVLGMLESLRIPFRRNLVERQVLTTPRSVFSEGVNDIRTALLLSRVEQTKHTVLVTSSVPGVGKTTFSANLALAFAQRGKTLLLDADLRKGRIAVVAGQTGAHGLTDLVLGDCDLESVIRVDPEVENLHVLSGGSGAPNPLEVLSSEPFRKIIAYLESAFEFVVIDAAPLLPVSDSIVVAPLATSVLFVVESEKTTHQMAIDALRRLASARVRPAGVVLQKVNIRRLSWHNSDYAGLYKGYEGYAKTA